MDRARPISMDISPVATTTRSLSFATRQNHCGGLWADALGAITAARLVGTVRKSVSANAEFVWTVSEDIQKYTDGPIGVESSSMVSIHHYLVS
jgi:hypothetical protein